MSPTDLMMAMRKLTSADSFLGISLFEAQFKVSIFLLGNQFSLILLTTEQVLQLLTPRPDEVLRNVALAHTKQNRSFRFLPRMSLPFYFSKPFSIPFCSADSYVVPLCGEDEETDYIHASFLDVSTL